MPECPQCGPQGGKGWIDGIRFRHPCDLCWSTHRARWKIIAGAESIRMHGGHGSWQVTLRRQRFDRHGADHLGLPVAIVPGRRVAWQLDPHDYAWVVALFSVPETPGLG